MFKNIKYETYKETELSGKWITYNRLLPLLEKYKKLPFKQTVLGYSYKSIPISQIQVGEGPIKIILWSQMHGDESTATKSIFDILNFIAKAYLTNNALINLLNSCTLTFIPLLNPDGALLYTRENAEGIDLNRDALNLETSEAKVLNDIVKRIKPDYAFNLHDQTSFYNVTGTEKPASLSFLAPAEDEARTITATRKRAMSVIVSMYNILQNDIGDQIGRYNDAYCDNCFGDNIQKMGIPTILIESGYYPNDEPREITRKLHFKALLQALFQIAFNKLPSFDNYFEIPLNEKRFYDLMVTNVNKGSDLVSIGFRFKYSVIDGELVKLIEEEKVLSKSDVENLLFHKKIDAKNLDYKYIHIDFLNNY